MDKFLILSTTILVVVLIMILTFRQLYNYINKNIHEQESKNRVVSNRLTVLENH